MAIKAFFEYELDIVVSSFDQQIESEMKELEKSYILNVDESL